MKLLYRKTIRVNGEVKKIGAVRLSMWEQHVLAKENIKRCKEFKTGK